jgi:ATP-binding cassette subfamily F protein 3
VAVAAPKAAPAPAAAKTASPADPAKRKDDRKDDRKSSAQARQNLAAQTRPLRNELQQTDKRIEALAAERTELEAAIVAGKMSGPDMAEAGRRLNHIGAEVAMLEERWLELNEQIDALNASAG